MQFNLTFDILNFQKEIPNEKEMNQDLQVAKKSKGPH